ncbi:hypothetical protein BT67DRAFT_93836 [Trichocladium antarcticum]|uniref:Uncharacterized protein n=1 Tax=Trichocladium antarcticum TaxID=1450529 RepID=A0AAN6UG97_9PEZI|nr:hypothetical protein BT67DRAFT_93836 [Trichocladium antarcticum]
MERVTQPSPLEDDICGPDGSVGRSPTPANLGSTRSCGFPLLRQDGTRASAASSITGPVPSGPTTSSLAASPPSRSMACSRGSRMGRTLCVFVTERTHVRLMKCVRRGSGGSVVCAGLRGGVLAVLDLWTAGAVYWMGGFGSRLSFLVYVCWEGCD